MNPVLFLIFTFLCSRGGLDFPLAAGISTIGSGEELNSSSLLESDGGNFTLGFFTIPQTDYTYLGICYTNDEQRRKVWVANPNTPLNNNVTAALTIDNTTGILKITSGGNTVLNISNQQAVNPTARIEDSGNLVLTDGTEKQSLWQSFDNPTNTLLPGMKLGFNTATGQNWNLTSWISDYVPASGAFTLGWEPTQDSGQLVVYRRGERYWTSGPLKDQSFEYLYDPWTLYYYNFSVVSNNDEKYLTFSSINVSLWMWELTPNGEIVDDANARTYGPGYGFCYGYESVPPFCVTSELPQCRSSNDKFEEKRASFLPTIATSEYEENTSLSLSDCMERCWNDCNCVAFTVNSIGTGCITWRGKLEYQEDNPDVSKSYVLVRGSSSKGEEKKRRKEYLQELIPTDSFNNVHHIDNDGTEVVPLFMRYSGYMSPEYAMEGTFSEKSDVFSFGVLILEIISGRRNTSFYDVDNRPLNLIGYAWELWKEGTALELKDPTLGDSCAENELLRIIHVGLLCVQEGATDRPIMSDVISMLNNETMVLPAPTRPAFFTGRNVPRTVMSSERKPQDCSTNNLTTSIIEPR
ncbi:hypothetical protein RHSIM_Rhsim07G0135900 [Rhododendron simsii]|uniref:Uncharacterized protein n=1 Tax=Rhododendron simsii TaxID=118357 RepID=A0A834LJL4_RHOSS|nr:hypothetical protein RHSIM_Rhsim07G0135900 [Rhododendron simsii]